MMSIPCSALYRHVADAHDQFLGVERLAGVVGRAGLLAAAALGAGEPVEQVLPAEVLERLEPERRILVLEVELRQLAARRELAEEDVREGGRDVQVLAERQVAEERGDQRDVRPPQDREDGLEDVGREVPQRDRDRVRDEGARDVAMGGDLEELREQLGGDHPADHAEDDERVAVEGQAPRLEHEPPVVGPADRGQDDDRDHVLHRADQGPDDPVGGDLEDGLDDPAGDDVGGADGQQHEAPEDAGMHGGGTRVLEHLCLQERVFDEADHARRDMGERPRRPRDREDPKMSGHGEDEEERRAPEDEEDQRVAGDVLERREHQRSGPPSSMRSGVIA